MTFKKIMYNVTERLAVPKKDKSEFLIKNGLLMRHTIEETTKEIRQRQLKLAEKLEKRLFSQLKKYSKIQSKQLKKFDKKYKKMKK